MFFAFARGPFILCASASPNEILFQPKYPKKSRTNRETNRVYRCLIGRWSERRHSHFENLVDTTGRGQDGETSSHFLPLPELPKGKCLGKDRSTSNTMTYTTPTGRSPP